MDVKVTTLFWKSAAWLGTGITVETMSLWSQTRAASQGPWKYLPCPSLPLLPSLIMGTILASGSQPGLLRASPGTNGDGQAPSAAAQFAAGPSAGALAQGAGGGGAGF